MDSEGDTSDPLSPLSSSSSIFDRDLHVTSLEMMYQLLPSEYQSQEINSLTLAYFVISGLDLLGALDRALMAESGGPAIGIDLGTTNSCVGVWMNGRVEIIINEQGKRTTPSYVAFTDFQRLIGDNAKRQVAINPMNTVFDAKRLIGRKFSDEIVQKDLKLWPFRVVEGPRDEPEIVVIHRGQEKRMTPIEISAMVLEKMREIATAKLGCPVKNAVVTVPAYFNDSQRQATMDAGVIAGLNVMRIINEPTAAAIAYGLDKKYDTGGRKTVLVFDLGGGTLDVSLLSIHQGKIEVKATNGDSHLGGEDFDNRMVNHFVDEFAIKTNQDIRGNPKAIRRLRNSCEEAKILLSEAEIASLSIDCLYNGIDFSSSITRAMFVEINRDLFRKCMQAVENCLNDANMEKSYVDEVVLVGGSTRIPHLQYLLQEFFNGKQLCKSVNPDEAVAQGAAIQAAKMTGKCDGDLRNFNFSEVTPLSIAVETDSGEATVLIPKNSKIPTEKQYVCTTFEDNQTKIKILVLEGQGVEIAMRRNVIGSIELNGIPPAPKGSQKISLLFQINSNGILTMTAEDQTNGSRDYKNKTTITIERRTMSKEEIKKNSRQTEKYMAEDEELRKRVKAKNALQTYVFNMQISIVNDEDLGLRLGWEDKKTLEDAILNVNKWLENAVIAGVDDYKKMLKDLDSVCYPIINKIHEARKAKLQRSSTGSRRFDNPEDMTIRHWSHGHALKLLPLETPCLCNGCQVLVFKPCYQCDQNLCNYRLHEECAMASSNGFHPFLRDCEFKFYRRYKNPNNETCDGCGKDLKGFLYQCSHKEPHKLHPCCLKLEKTLVGHGVMLHLIRSSSSKCAKCGQKEVLKGFKGWSYVSSDGTCSYHVACVKDLFYEQWKEYNFNRSPSGGSSGRYENMKNLERRITVPRKQPGESSIVKKVGKFFENAKISLFLIFSTLFGGPSDYLLDLAGASVLEN